MSLSPRCSDCSGSQLTVTTLTLTTLFWFRTGEVVAYCSFLVLLLFLTMVVSSYLVLQWIHLALLVRVGGMFFLEGFISGSVNPKLITWQHGSLSPLVVSVFLMTAVVPSFLKTSLSRTMLVISHLVIYGSYLQGFAFTDLHVICRHYKKAAR